MPVYLLATLDTKGLEAGYLRDQLRALGVDAQLVDTSTLGPPAIPPDVSRDELRAHSKEAAAPSTSVSVSDSARDRGIAVAMMAQCAVYWIRHQQSQGNVSGVIGVGGSAGTAIGTAAMRALPLGVPKVMISTLASGQVRSFVGDKDIFMLNAVADISGINRITRLVLDQAARAMAGLVTLRQSRHKTNERDKPLVAASMFGVTTPCVERARQVLEQAGYEVLVFHATGTGGQTLESLAADGQLAGVLDITTTELADELVGGVLSAGPTRLTAAGQRGIPQVVSVGATDMVNFGPWDSVPERFRNRLLHRHNPAVTLMRTTLEENRQLGAEIGRKVAAATGPVRVLLPRRGVSALDAAGQPFDDPQARAALFAEIRAHCGAARVEELDLHINDRAFAETAANALIEMMNVTHPSNRNG